MCDMDFLSCFTVKGFYWLKPHTSFNFLCLFLWLLTLIFIHNFLCVKLLFNKLNSYGFEPSAARDNIQNDLMVVTLRLEEWSVVCPQFFTNNFIITSIAMYAGDSKIIYICSNLYTINKGLKWETEVSTRLHYSIQTSSLCRKDWIYGAWY